MKIKHIKIENFRGIKSLEWTVKSDVVCLVGKGDSTKTTLLKAIEFALYPSSQLNIDDQDFYDCDTNNLISIEVSLTDLPSNIYEWGKEGLLLRGWDSTKAVIVDEPNISVGHEYLLTIKLIIDDSLEPSWSVYNDRLEDIKHLNDRERRTLGMYFIGNYLDSDLTLSKNSVLNRILSNTKEVKNILLDLKKKINTDAYVQSEVLNTLSGDIKIGADTYGVKLDSDTGFRFILNGVNGFTGNAIRLSKGNVPLTSLGLGSKKLLAISLHRALTDQKAIILIDELEQGLEPHRLRHLIRKLKKDVDMDLGQVFTTSHSSVALEEFGAVFIHVVRNNAGVVNVLQVPENLQDIARVGSEVFLSNNIIVGEGKTEVGIALSFDEYNQHLSSGVNFSLNSIHLMDGGGDDSAYKRAKSLRSLGFNVCLILDSDNPNLNIDENELNVLGIELIRWDNNSCIESRILLDAPDIVVDEVLKLVEKDKGVESLHQSLSSKLGKNIPRGTTNNIESITSALAITKLDFKKALGEKLNKDDGRFKDIDRGREFGSLIFKHLGAFSTESDTIKKLNKLGAWCYGDGYNIFGTTSNS